MPRLITEQIQTIPQLLSQGLNRAQIARKFKCSQSAISTRVRGVKSHKHRGSIRSVGRPSKLTKSQKERVIKIVQHKNHLGTQKLVHYINDKIDTDASDRTLRNVSKETLFKFNFPVEKPLLTERHKKIG